MSKFLRGIFGSLIKPVPVIEKRMKNTCFTKENFEEIDYDDLLKILSFLQGRTETKQPEAISALFTHIKDCGELSLQRRLKYLALIHKSIKKIGFEFAEDFLASRPCNLREKPVLGSTNGASGGNASKTKDKQKAAAAMVFQYIDIESWLDEYVLKHYYDYLMRMSLNLETYKTCLLSDKEPTTMGPAGAAVAGGMSSEGVSGNSMGTNNGNPLRMMVLFKVSNLVNFVMKLQKQFVIIFSEFKFIAIAKDIAYMVLKDCVIYYNYMHRQIMHMVTNYESMVENDQMQFYELFIELIKLNSALHDFGKLRKFFDDDDSIEQPLVLNITKERARQIDRNHRKIVLKNEEMQRDRKKKLQQQMSGNGGGNAAGTAHGKRLSFLSKTGGSMTSRGLTSNWKQNEQICEVTNDDEEEDFKTKFQKKPGNLYKKVPTNSLAGGEAMLLNMGNLNLENMYGQEGLVKGAGKAGDIAGGMGFNTDRVVYSHNQPECSSDAQDEDKSDSTKETKKDDTFTRSSKSKHEIQEQ